MHVRKGNCFGMLHSRNSRTKNKEMAYSQVEVASSFGCVLKDHNRRERCNRDCNSMASAAFQKNLKELVRDNLHNCISVSSDSDENLQNHHVGNNNTNINNRQQLRCLTNCQDDNNNNHGDSSTMSCKQQTTILDRWAVTQAQEMVSTIEEMVASRNSSKNSQKSASFNGGASSLVQIWEARLNSNEPKIARSISMKNSPTSGPSLSSRNCAANEDSMADWDSTAPSSSSASDGGEKERVRIVDIIKRLTSDTTNCNEQGSSSLNSPKIRGRRVYNDFLLHLEQDRQRELNLLAQRHSVSRFSQRGRIQAILRVRCLQRGMAIQDQQRVQSIRLTRPSNATNTSQQGPTIMPLRERFSRGAADGCTSSFTASTSSKCSEEIENSIVNNENCSKLDQGINNNCTSERRARSQTDDSLSQMSEDVHEESSASSDVTWQGTTSEANNFDPGEVSESSSEANNFDPGEVFESTLPLDNWDGNETYDEDDFGVSNHDWFADIARPRSYWEDLRREWYQEILCTRADNNEIKQLLERRTVSTFLASDFRERMDQLMASHVQMQTNREDEELEEEGQERMGQLIRSFFQQQSHLSSRQPEEEDQDALEGAGDADVEVGQDLCEEVDQHVEEEEEENPSSNFSHHREVADSDQVLHQSQQSGTSNQGRRIFPAPNQSSSEMDLMYELRGHMEQLQREVSELRKAMQTCMEMQAELQSSMKQEVHPVQEAAKNSIDMTRKRNCCICYEMQVDSFLYRCGHMCTCLKCAHELQWSTGKCPICRAPILDVVRAYMDS